ARTLARTLARALDCARSRDLNPLVRPTPDHARVRDLALDLDHARDRVLGLALDLDRVLDRVPDRDLNRDLDRASAHLDRTLARVLDLDLALALAIWAAQLLSEAVDAIPVDASGADLSALRVSDLAVLADVLAGVVWDERTVWPAGWRERVYLRSEPLGGGRYRVRGGTERDPVSGVPVT
ncbi:hypothetical protein, partial [Actinomadura sp. 6N118]|uniref:hypothetical protein n=1 Tax=Actinomadura sp. 6N118 TaxID=3375151 RepID=UPI0037BBAEB3